MLSSPHGSLDRFPTGDIGFILKEAMDGRDAIGGGGLGQSAVR